MSQRKVESDVIDSGMFLRKNGAAQFVRYYPVDGLYTHELVSGTFLKRTKTDWVVSVSGETRHLDRKAWQPCSRG
jgi:hypothetical protein